MLETKSVLKLWNLQTVKQMQMKAGGQQKSHYSSFRGWGSPATRAVVQLHFGQQKFP